MELEMEPKIMNLKLVENKLKKKRCKYKSSYDQLRRDNEELKKVNNFLEQKLHDKTQQLNEITMELKEFNVMLEEEITERTKTEDALKESESQFRYSVEEAPLPIMLYTENGEVKKINRSWTDITGYTVNDMPTTSEWANICDVFIEQLNGVNPNKMFNLKERQDDG